MSGDNDNQDSPKTKPLRKTSAVPLRKETVRVTLKATPGGTSGAPVPPAPAPPKPPSVATAPLNGPVTASLDASDQIGESLPEATSSIPLRQETMRVTLKADHSGVPMAPAPSAPGVQASPTVALGGSVPPAPSAPSMQASPTVALGAPTPNQQVPSQSPTIALSSTNIPVPTQEIGATTAGSQPLPTATVQLQQTQPMGSTMGSIAPMPAAHTSWEDEVNKGEKATMILSAVALIAAVIAFAIQFLHAKDWVEEHKQGDFVSVFSTEQSFDIKTDSTQYKTVQK